MASCWPPGWPARIRIECCPSSRSSARIQRAVEEQLVGSGPVRTPTAVEVDLIVGDQSLPRHLARILHIPRGLTGHQPLHEKERAALRELARYLHQLHLIDATVVVLIGLGHRRAAVAFRPSDRALSGAGVMACSASVVTRLML
jgi:hypothetical protein